MSGGHGGHNGLRNIIQACGGNTFHRLRIGIGSPTIKNTMTNYVLSKPSREQGILINNAIQQSCIYLLDFIQEKTIQVSCSLSS